MDTENEPCAFLVLRRPVHFAELHVAKVVAGGIVVAASDTVVVVAAAAADDDDDEPGGGYWHYRTRLIFVSEHTKIRMALRSETATAIENVWQKSKHYYSVGNADSCYCFGHWELKAMTVSVSGAMGCDEQRWLHRRRPQAVM